MAIHNNNEPRPNPYGTDAHDEAFAGSTNLHAKHLVEDHGFRSEEVAPYEDKHSEAAWSALDSLHRQARSLHG